MVFCILLFFSYRPPAYDQAIESITHSTVLRSLISPSSDKTVLSELRSSGFTKIAERRISEKGIRVKSIQVADASYLTKIPSEKFSAYFQSVTGYSKYLADSVLLNWKKNNARIAALNWSVLKSTGDTSFNSVAVFSSEGQLLFDGILSNLITDVSDKKQLTTMDPNDTKTLETSARVTSLTGSVTLHWRVGFTAEISPYIDPMTNDGLYNLASSQITCWKTDPSGIPPQGEPVVYFGQFGTSGDKDDPFESTITIDGTIDHFGAGNYTSYISDGRGKSWSADFNVIYNEGISISPPDDQDSPLWLGTSSSSGRTINILDNIYVSSSDRRYRGVFWNSGSMKLNNFILKAEDGGSEIGTVMADIPVNCAYTFWDDSPIFQDVCKAGTISLTTSYVRGHRIPDPLCTLSANSFSVISGQQITITVRVFNPSTVVDVDSGSVNLDLSSIDSHFSIIGNSSIPLDVIPAGQYKDYSFILQGISVGAATPLATISGRWGYPAGDPGRIFSVTTSSDKSIEVLPVPSITITAPNGGESLQAGSMQNIAWTSIGTSGKVQILYSTDNGTTWITINSDETDDGSCSWPVPDINSITCLVSVIDADGTPSDRSNSIFTISRVSVITIGSPNGGEIWESGTNQTITWTSLGTTGSLQIFYSVDNGSTWTEIIESTQDDGSYEWAVPYLYSPTCLVRIIDASGSPTDQSNSFFTISPKAEIVVSSPDGGESWQAGSNQSITWTSSGTSGNVRISYSVDNGSRWIEVINSTPDNGLYNWIIPNTPSSTCLVRVSNADGILSDQSNSVFAITPVPEIYVTSPNNGETWLTGTGQDIIWRSVGTSGNVQILYSTDNGSNWSEIINSTPDDGSFTWTIPDSRSTTCLVMIRDVDGSPVDQSNTIFTITNVCVPVTIVSQPPDDEICVNQGSASFTAVAAGTPPLIYQWQFNNSGEWINVVNGIPSGAVYSNENTTAFEVRGIKSPGVYQYRCFITNCFDANATSNEVTLTVRSNPSVIIPGPVTQPTCNNPAGSIVINGLPSTGTWTLTQMPGSKEITGTGTNLALTDLPPGLFTYTVRNVWGCISDISEPVFIQTPDEGVIPKITIKYDDVLICYNLGDSLISYQWFKDQNPIDGATLQYYQTQKQPGIYSVHTVDFNGCANTSNQINITGSGSLKAYPNPASVSFALKFEDYYEGEAIIRILTSTGIKVMEFEMKSIKNELLDEISVTTLREGVYFVQVMINRKETYFTKVVVTK